MKKYTKPELEQVSFETEVITTDIPEIPEIPEMGANPGSWEADM